MCPQIQFSISTAENLHASMHGGKRVSHTEAKTTFTKMDLAPAQLKIILNAPFFEKEPCVASTRSRIILPRPLGIFLSCMKSQP